MPRGGKRTGAGRPKGAPNKVTAEVREAIAMAAQASAPNIQSWLKKIKDPARRLELFLRMLEYHIPKLSRAELTGKDGGSVVVEIHKIAAPTAAE